MGLAHRIELCSLGYKASALPLGYASMGLEIRIELIFRRYECRVLPLDDSSENKKRGANLSE